MDSVLRDLELAFRGLRRTPAFTAAAVATLALGIGANTAIFSVVSRVLLEPPPFPEPDRVVMLLNRSPQGRNAAASPAKFAHWRRQADALVDVTAFRLATVNFTDGATPERLRAVSASAAYFRLFGATLARGRAFTAEEDRPGGRRVAIISDGFWSRRFDRDPDVLGTTLSLAGEPHAVIGVMSATFDFADLGPPPDVWLPFQLPADSSDHGHYFSVSGRLAPGVTLAQADERLARSADAFRSQFPEALGPDAAFGVAPVRDVLVESSRVSLLVLTGAVAFVLLIACANVANLLLVRASARRRELAIRAAIGAGRGRLVRQLLTESLLLAIAGGGLGLAVGAVGIRALLAVDTAGLPRVGDGGTVVSLDWRVLAFTIVVSVTTGLLFGLAPALHGTRRDLASALEEGGGRGGSSGRGAAARSLLVVAEVSLALVLLVGSALLMRTSVALSAVEPGFDQTNVVSTRMSLNEPRYATSAAVHELVRNGSERLRALPGVEVAAATCCVPLEGGFGLPFVIVGRPLEGASHGGSGWTTVSAGYFDVFRIPVLRGRAFTPRDDGQAPPVVVISETMARRFWPDSDPLADRLAIGRGVMRHFADEPDRQIIGIVGDVRATGLDSEPTPMVYIPQGQVPDAANALNASIAPMSWVVRTRATPAAMIDAIEAELRDASGLPVYGSQTMDETVRRSTSRHRFNMWLMTVFGAVAVALAAIGIYGLMAFAVEQRRPEIGIRLALGSAPGGVRRLVLGQGLWPLAAGLAAGLACAVALTRFVASLLFGVEPLDLATFAAMPTLLSLVALAAMALPVWRASRIDPIEALREQ